MDTKLRNYHRMGVVLVLLTIIAMTAAVMASYPWLKEQAFMNAELITSNSNYDVYEGYWMTINGDEYLFHNFGKFEQIVAWMLLGFSFLTAAVAFITGLIKPLGITERKFFAMPFELLILIGGCALAFMSDGGYLVMEVVAGTVTGVFASELVRELNFSYQQAYGILMAGNAVMWAVGITFIYWFVVSLDSIFTMGLTRWLKERTIIGWLLMGGKNAVEKTCGLVGSVDFRDKQTKLLLKIVGINFVLLTVISCFWFFGIFGLMIYSVVLFFLLRRIYDGMQEKYEILLQATGKMADGNLEVEINDDLGVFEPLKGEITKIRNGFKKAVEEEVKSQSMKTELITNVSHDLKTPLTAIITYVNLLKKEGITEEERRNYIRILDQKSMRLKSLIEDLFEISKANSNNVTLHLVEVDIVSLMKQVRLELEDKIGRSQVEFRWNMPDDKAVLILDSEKTYRVFENLLVNIVKYALPGTRAYVEITDDGETVMVSMKNISATEISLEGRDITDRFVRGDESRNTEGSGLGLAIARSFVELQKGTMEVGIEADLFKVKIEWDRNRMPDKAEDMLVNEAE
ncbi:HAMP domain-containing sensor histidine kinase [[Clostridium] symbiosum]|uniref:sensor histidine kinase n=1 Tax=Clostridium symbiosum TaxID=1512 RepID=UPI00189F3D54|nr:HAMP domain-containing sensor histidine kinase [[Clostridium] symbiosum]MDB2038344.1 HAMP domain-containing sensor histidine kinase [[Clostridium] symbiosum]